MSGSSLEKFMKQKGPSAGCESIIFYVAYVFFEKVRLRDRKPKTELRKEMEEVWKTYRDSATGKVGFLIRRGLLKLRGDEVPVEDKYGMVRFVRKDPR